MENAFREIYTRFKIHFYRHIFSAAGKHDGGLTVMDILSAEVIYALGSPTISEFASVLGISGPNATYRVRSLVNKGYAERVSSETDRREFNLRVTDKFKKEYVINEDYINVVSERLLRRFSHEDAMKFKEMIRIISDELMPEATIK